jgi:hypothetical protein
MIFSVKLYTCSEPPVPDNGTGKGSHMKLNIRQTNGRRVSLAFIIRYSS